MAKLDRVTNVVYNGSVSGETGSFTNNVTYTYKNDATYGESGLVEWDAHNDIYRLAKYISCDYANRVAHTDFDYNDESKTYEKYWHKAIKEALGL